jgi:hypothetical protein
LEKTDVLPAPSVAVAVNVVFLDRVGVSNRKWAIPRLSEEGESGLLLESESEVVDLVGDGKGGRLKHGGLLGVG